MIVEASQRLQFKFRGGRRAVRSGHMSGLSPAVFLADDDFPHGGRRDFPGQLSSGSFECKCRRAAHKSLKYCRFGTSFRPRRELGSSAGTHSKLTLLSRSGKRGENVRPGTSSGREGSAVCVLIMFPDAVWGFALFHLSRMGRKRGCTDVLI